MDGFFISRAALGETSKLCRALCASEQQLCQELTFTEIIIVLSMAQWSNLDWFAHCKVEDERCLKIKQFVFCNFCCCFAMGLGAHLFSY